MSDNKLSVYKGGGAVVVPEEKIALLKNSIMPQGSSNDDLELFLHICQRSGLDPFARQIYPMKQGNKLTTIVGIDGLRLIAQRTGEYTGQDGPYWCGPDGKWLDVWLKKEPPAACKVGVWRKGFTAPVWGVATWDSYGKQNAVWKQYPDVMLAKVAESLALRKCFASETSGLHAKEEMPETVGHTKPQPPPQAVYSGGQKQQESLAQTLFDMDITDLDTKKFEELSKALVGTPLSEIRRKIETLVLGVVHDAVVVS